MSETIVTVNANPQARGRQGAWARGRWRRTLLAATTALSLCGQNAAWAVCSDGGTLPASGFAAGVAPAANWSPHVFTGTTGSLFIPDVSVNESNAATQPLTGGGHNWVFDQGSALCKETDVGAANGATTAWAARPVFATDCVILPIIRGARVTGIGDLPVQGDVITPTCDPAILASGANTAFNQLGCAISHGVATTAQTAASFLFVAGVKSGLFSMQLTNNPTDSPDAGKNTGSLNYYSAIPAGTKLTGAAVSKDGRFVIATSDKRSPSVFACLNPLGDPGDPTRPIDPNFFVPSASAVACMLVGSNSLAVDSATAFGPDNQPYFAGQRPGSNAVTSFNGVPGAPGGSAAGAWPHCITRGTPFTIAQAFALKSGGHCGNAQPNDGFPAALLGQAAALIGHGSYLYAGTPGGDVVQTKVTVDPATGVSQYSKLRPYLAGTALVTGLGVADDLGALMVFGDPSGVGLSGQEVVTRLPLCEDVTP